MDEQLPTNGRLAPGITESGDQNALTSIHGCIHCSTTEATEPNETEADAAMINIFVNTLAEVALAVAARKIKGEGH